MNFNFVSQHYKTVYMFMKTTSKTKKQHLYLM